MFSLIVVAAGAEEADEAGAGNDTRSCCDSLILESGGMGDYYQVSTHSSSPVIDKHKHFICLCLQGSRLGKYILSGSSSSGRGIYTQQGGDNYLFFLVSEN